jgi:hypothetical protein
MRLEETVLRCFRIYCSLLEFTADGFSLRKTPMGYGHSDLHRIRKRRNRSARGLVYIYVI